MRLPWSVFQQPGKSDVLWHHKWYFCSLWTPAKTHEKKTMPDLEERKPFSNIKSRLKVLFDIHSKLITMIKKKKKGLLQSHGNTTVRVRIWVNMRRTALGGNMSYLGLCRWHTRPPLEQTLRDDVFGVLWALLAGGEALTHTLTHIAHSRRVQRWQPCTLDSDKQFKLPGERTRAGKWY